MCITTKTSITTNMSTQTRRMLEASVGRRAVRNDKVLHGIKQLWYKEWPMTCHFGPTRLWRGMANHGFEPRGGPYGIEGFKNG